MPLKAYKRGKTWWAKGRVEFNDRPITEYIRESTGASEKAGAEDWIRNRTELELRRYHFGDEQPPITLEEAALLTDLDPQSAKRIVPVVELYGKKRINDLNSEIIREICRTVQPNNSTDTWRRWILVPLKKIARTATSTGRCHKIEFDGFNNLERVTQDKKRGKQSRPPKKPGSREWLAAFKTTASPTLYVLARFMFETASRVGQATAMTPYHLSRLDENIVMIPCAKGHSETELEIDDTLANLLRSLEPKTPRGWAKKPENLRVFGYASKDGPTKAWNSACERANITRLTRHEAGRHGFATETFTRKGVDLKACTEYGRWADPMLFLKTYAHAEESTEKVLTAIRTTPVQKNEE
ncbi:tyrosine-type recombinase/integrase [Cohaesibacter intestini]|uniref:tyrosine-type recombinase/integrase n=1 Tax=Cohaesibacter intestini TaxID=2211145 RepID=UPI000DE8FFB2|nr:tyrosine-type recombinase/integrase [Cohaesibacter intestini]